MPFLSPQALASIIASLEAQGATVPLELRAAAEPQQAYPGLAIQNPPSYRPRDASAEPPNQHRSRASLYHRDVAFFLSLDAVLVSPRMRWRWILCYGSATESPAPTDPRATTSSARAAFPGGLLVFSFACTALSCACALLAIPLSAFALVALPCACTLTKLVTIQLADVGREFANQKSALHPPPSPNTQLARLFRIPITAFAYTIIASFAHTIFASFAHRIGSPRKTLPCRRPVKVAEMRGEAVEGEAVVEEVHRRICGRRTVCAGGIEGALGVRLPLDAYLARKVHARDVTANGQTLRGLPEQTTGRKGAKTGGKKPRQDVWIEDPNGGPPITQAAGRMLVTMAGVFNRDGRAALESILRGPSSTSVGASIDRTDIGALVNYLKDRSHSMKLYELDLMLSLVQLALNVDSEQRRAKLAGKSITKVKLAEKFTTVSRVVFTNWLTWGQRLLLLAGAGTLGVLVIFAALDLRTHITQQKHMSNADIICLASALREANHLKWLPLVNRLMIPLNYIRTSPGYIQTLVLRFIDHTPTGKHETVFGFAHPLVADSIFDDIQTKCGPFFFYLTLPDVSSLIRPVARETKQSTTSTDDASSDDEYFHLPARAAAWDFTQPTVLWKPLTDPEEVGLPKPFTIKTSLKGKKTCPVKKKTRHEWTEKQRAYADKAPVATSLADLETKLKGIHQSGTSAPGKYVELNSDTLEGNTLFIRDADGKLISLYFKIPEDYVASLRAAQDHIHTILHGEWKDEDSRRKAFKYLSLHYSWYCRFAEQGDTAPKNLHPNKCRKKNVSRVNITQRVPHQTQEISEDPEAYVGLADAFTSYFEIVSQAMTIYLPEETKELKMFVEELPLAATSPCYPFAGFVANISSCTWAHRDGKDLKLCLIGALGKHTGGQLCLHEAGLKFDLKLGDVLVFPSGELTHFNCHFKGYRMTVVLHTDREALKWTSKSNGWGHYVVRHQREEGDETEEESDGLHRRRAAPKKKVLAAHNDADESGDDGGDASEADVAGPTTANDKPLPVAKQKTTSQKYTKLSQIQHILIRPDSYIGSVEMLTQTMWTHDKETNKMVHRDVTFVPGFFKIVDKILVNAADHKINDPNMDPNMDQLKIEVDVEAGTISVYNNGHTIPIEMHATENCYIPELIFGHLLAGSNFDDDEKKLTGGRNGYGAKLTNIYSHEFTVETAHKKSGQKYKQTWTDNMGTVGKAKITKNSKGEEWTKITFGQFQHVAFANSISTTKGGTHVNLMADQIAKNLLAAIGKKNKGAQVKNHMWIFVNALIENPGMLTGLPKLADANNAGTKSAKDCTLILTEGDSAKSLAIAGLSVVGRDNFGVFPLRGKLLNVREARHDQIMKNEEIQAIKKIMGLQHAKDYTSTSSLRYGRLMIMADQDHDGSHIKGLIINFLDHFYPSLLKLEDFLVEFVTPIVRVTKGATKKDFFTLPEYEQWSEETPNSSKWDVKYYKGLRTSKDSDARDYSSHMEKHMIPFARTQEGDRDHIDLAFSKKKTEERKEWLQQFKPGTFLDHRLEEIPYSDFINKELILFSMVDNIRSIPSVADGLKPAQRKVMWGCFRRNMRKELKVAQPIGYIGEHAAYHHGELSLSATIINLAQMYVGSNNINLLEPNGQFGTRDTGGKDHASARYINTLPTKIARAIYHPHDDPLLTQQRDDNLLVEPEWYMPAVPLVLINGAESIGTGWSTNIPCFKPDDIVANLRRKMNDEEMVPMHPWWRGYNGEIKPTAKHKYDVLGVVKKINATTVEITELPIHKWTSSYKIELDAMIAGKENEPGTIKVCVPPPNTESDNENVHFVVSMDAKQLEKAEAKGLIEFFKLTGKLTTSNMICFDFEGKIKKYNLPEEIIEDFYRVRLGYHQKRKDHLALELQNMIVDRELIVSNRKKADIIVDLKKHKFRPFPKISKAKEAGETEEALEQEEDEGGSSNAGDYDYLLGMAISSLTKEKIEKLLQSAADKESELLVLLKISSKELWNADLYNFLVMWEALKRDLELKKYVDSNGKKIKRKQTVLKTRKSIGRRAASDSEDDFRPIKAAKRKAPEPKRKALEPKRKAAAKEEDDDDEAAKDESDNEVEVVKRALPKTAKGARGLLDTAVDSDEEPPKKKKARATENLQEHESMKPASLPKPKKAPPKKYEDSEDDDMYDEVPVAPTRRAPSRPSCAKPKKYVEIPSDDDD
ncbi:DNA topoisomerase [Mycena filopes]|nr:DNA topoisomerase [Mycena filopes]